MKIYLLIMISVSFSLFSQTKDTIFYNSNWNKINSSDSASFYRLSEVLNDSITKINDYYLSTNSIQCTGEFTNEKKTGRWTFYNAKGEITKDYKYINNKGNRHWYKFDEGDLKPNKEGVYHTVNVFPKYEDGANSLNNYIVKNFELPKKAIKKGVYTFNVNYKLIIDSEGKIIEVKEAMVAYKKANGKYYFKKPKSEVKYGINKKLKKLLMDMPNWTPATVKGKPVKTAHNITINYNNN